MTNIDPTDADLVVNGRIISEFAGLSDWNRVKESSYAATPGGVRVATQRQRGANGIDFTIKVKRTSTDMAFLDDLVDSQDEIPILGVITRNLGSYEVGQELALGCELGMLTGGSRGVGDSEESDDIDFTVQGRGPVRQVKQ